MNNTSVKYKSSKKYNSNVLKYVQWDQFDASKLGDIKSYVSKNHPSFTLLQPLYRYTDKVVDTLYYKTPFIKLTENMVSRYQQTMPDYVNFDLNNLNLSDTMLSFLENYDQKVFNVISEKEYSYVKPLLSNTGYNDLTKCEVNKDLPFKKLPLYFLKDKQSGNITSEIINYNISKKYPKVETFNRTNVIKLDDLVRCLKKNKEVRFILKPYSWYDSNNKVAGSKMQLVTMEIKFDGAKINSLVDEEEVVEPLNIIKEVDI
jgi:hypothetical protein